MEKNPAAKNITVIKHDKEEMTMEEFKKNYPHMIKEENAKQENLVVNLPLGHQLYKAGVGKLPGSPEGKEKRQPKGN